MGLMRKRDEEDRAYIEGIEIIERSDVPDDLDEVPVEVVASDRADDADDEGRVVDSGERDETGAIFDDAARTDDDDVADDEDDADDEAKDSDLGASDEPAGEDPRDEEDVDADAEAGPLQRLLGNPRLMVACLVIAVVVAGILGYAVGSGAFTQHGAGTATLTEDQLDTPVASYTYAGATHQVTAREALESAYILSNIQNDDDTYPAPSAEVTVACVRRNILVAEARSRGIEATDDELAAYAQDALGTSDFAALAEQYATTEDQVREIAENSLLVQKLYEQIAPETVGLTVPTMPTAPEDGNQDTASADYASYIIDLAGDEWDADAGTWARTDGPLYQALSGESFTADSATYAQALTAYYVAYQQYSDTATQAQEAWSEYANGIYEGVTLNVYGLYQ